MKDLIVKMDNTFRRSAIPDLAFTECNDTHASRGPLIVES